MKKLGGYFLTLKNYLRTPKARHDLKDYARAVCMILLTTAIILILVTILIGSDY